MCFRRLNLEDNCFQDEGVLHISRSLKGFTNLESLALGNNQMLGFSRATLEEIHDLLGHMDGLKLTTDDSDMDYDEYADYYDELYADEYAGSGDEGYHDDEDDDDGDDEMEDI